MAVSLPQQILTAVRAVIVAPSAELVPLATRVRVRPNLDWVADRDTAPGEHCVAVGWTPGRGVGRLERIRRRDYTVGVTCLLVGPKELADPDGRRPGWAVRVAGAVCGASLAGVPSVFRVSMDGGTAFDPGPFNQAGVYHATLSLLVSYRVGVAG